MMMNNAGSPFLRLLSRGTIQSHCRRIGTTNKQMFYERDSKSGYPRKSDYHDEPKSILGQLQDGYKNLVTELKLFKEEFKDNFHMDPTMILRPGEVDVQWRFNGDPSILDQWVVTADSDYGEGESTASLQLTQRGRGIFTGFLNPRNYRDGKVKRSGYCNIKSVRPQKSFQRSTYLNWGPYNHLVLRIRGDGRNYLVTLGSPGEWDILWNDSYQYILYTRGGPYWQYVKIPFSKFFLVSKGRVQDTQQPPPSQRIANVGITAADKIPGNFKLEIDYIGVECDHIHDEDHAYEMYRPPTKFHI